MATKEFTFTVRGTWPFPVDMLRHDDARAASPADQDKIDNLSTEHLSDRDELKLVDVTLVAPRRPTTARWESFTWKVPGDVEHESYKAARQRELKRGELLKSALAKLTADERRLILSEMDRNA